MPAKPMLSSFAPARKPIFPSSWQRPSLKFQGWSQAPDFFRWRMRLRMRSMPIVACGLKRPEEIAGAVKSAGVATEFCIAQVSYPLLREYFVASARPNDVIILSRSGYYLSFDRNMIEAMLFTSGRPIVIVPPDWERGARLEKVVIAWDGSGRAARAVGDAMPMLTRGLRALSRSKLCMFLPVL